MLRNLCNLCNLCIYVLYCTVLYSTALCCSVLYCAVVYCIVLLGIRYFIFYHQSSNIMPKKSDSSHSKLHLKVIFVHLASSGDPTRKKTGKSVGGSSSWIGSCHDLSHCLRQFPYFDKFIKNDGTSTR